MLSADLRAGRNLSLGCAFVIFLTLTGCNTTPTGGFDRPAQTRPPAYHTVRSGDTLSRIALRYGLDQTQLAELNRLEPPYMIYVNQRLRLRPNSTSPQKTASNRSTVTTRPSTRVNTPPIYMPNAQPTIAAPVTSAPSALTWRWPVDLPLSEGYEPAQNRKGIRFLGQPGQLVQAAQDGDVVYASDGLKEYGNLVLLRHANGYVTAYAHLGQIQVREGMLVRQGEPVGSLASAPLPAMLEFQIRWNGKPVNPVTLLPSR